MKTHKRSRTLLALLAGIALANSSVSFATESNLETEFVSLKALHERASERNPSIAAARHAWEAAKLRIPQARAYRNPMLTYSPDTGQRAETRAGPQANGLAIMQAIPFPGKLTLKGEIAGKEALAVFERYRATEDEVHRQLRARFADYALAAHSLQVNGDIARLTHQLAAVAMAKYQVGTAAQPDVILAQEQLTRLEADRTRFQADRNAATGAINALLDQDSLAPLGFPAEVTVAPPERPLSELFEEALGSRPELRAQDHAIAAGQQAIRLARMEYLPDFQIGAQWIEVEGGTNPMFSRDGQDIWAASLGLSIPLWTDRIRAGVEESRARLLERETTRRELRNRVQNAVQTAFEKLRSAARTEEIFRTTLIPQTEERIAASRAGYETGLVDFLNLIDALRSLERVSLDRYRAVREHQHALADLERAVGTDLSRPSEKKL